MYNCTNQRMEIQFRRVDLLRLVGSARRNDISGIDESQWQSQGTYSTGRVFPRAPPSRYRFNKAYTWDGHIFILTICETSFYCRSKILWLRTHGCKTSILDGKQRICTNSERMVFYELSRFNGKAIETMRDDVFSWETWLWSENYNFLGYNFYLKSLVTAFVNG